MKKYQHRGTTGLFAQPIGKGLNQFHQKSFDKSKLELLRLATHWSDIVGSFMVESCFPVKIHITKSTGSLHISCSSAIALELQHMQPVILQRTQKFLGHSKIQRIKLIQSY